MVKNLFISTWKTRVTTVEKNQGKFIHKERGSNPESYPLILKR